MVGFKLIDSLFKQLHKSYFHTVQLSQKKNMACLVLCCFYVKTVHSSTIYVQLPKM